MLIKSELLKKIPRHEIIDRINDVFNLWIEYDKVFISLVNPTYDRRIEINVKGGSSDPLQSNFLNEFNVLIDRYVLNEHLDSLDLVCDHPNPQTTQPLIDILTLKYQTPISLEDFVARPISPGSTTAILEAQPTSLRWVGSVTFSLLNPPTSTTILAV